MLQSQYEHLYDNITFDNMHEMVKQAEGTVVVEDYRFIRATQRIDPYDKQKLIDCNLFVVNTAGMSIEYWAYADSKLLFTQTNQLSVFRLP